MKKTIGTIFIITLSAIIMVGCGIKPKTLDAPTSIESDSFPRSYPAP